ncbi:hypothetical protein [uncultured Legionella sp.]|uniref:hypothetical protein n=1 Tax=uncultured Legionella sp. TaxID=210934 RepID=UPI0026342144|nr:hypothetical protein [uncultured Legionella sp.]
MNLANKLNKIQWASTPQKLIDIGLKLSLLLILILVFVPFSPKMPAPGLDASWALGLNQAVAQGLNFGKEIIFTLGPYSAIYTKFYHPATDLMMIGGSLYLALSYWLGIVLLIRGIKWRWSIAFATLLFGMIYARDSLFFSYPLLISLLCFKNEYQNDKKDNHPLLTLPLIAFLFAPLGLLTLIKGSLLIIGIALSLLCTVFFALHQQRNKALLCLTSPLVSLILFWELAGQSLFYLPHYLFNSIVMASGFSESMALDGDNKEIILYLIASCLVLFTIIRQKELLPVIRLFYFIAFFLFLFLSFKAGFTRHLGHSFITGTSILIAALLLPFLFHSKKIIPVLIFALYTTSYIDGQHTKISLLNNFISTYSSSWYGLKNRLADKTWVKQNYMAIMGYLQDQAQFPALSGTTDAYSYDQSYLFASDMNWLPRPIFQSYTVFTSKMAHKNKDHLLRPNSPDNIIFKVQPIDGRIPSLEDGVSWPALLHHYHPVQLVRDYLVLRKNSTMTIEPTMPILKSEHHVLGEKVLLPDSNLPLFVELNINSTLWGHTATILFKPKSLEATIELNNGERRQFRIIASMARSGFLLSPLIEETAEFGLLFSNNDFLERKKVKSIMIASTPNNSNQWNTEYDIIFKKIIMK